MKKLVTKICWNFIPTLLSIAVLQLVILPRLYIDGDYLVFNQLLYIPLLFVHVLNTGSFNFAVVNKERDSMKYNIYPFVFFYVIYLFVVIIYGITYSSLTMTAIFFILGLYPIDAILNILRIQELDKCIALILVLQITIFFLLYVILNVNVFYSYIFSNVITFIYGVFLSYKRKNSIFIKRISFNNILLKSNIFKLSIPTLNRYVDKIFLLILLIPSYSTIIFPYISISGLILMPLSSVSKVVIRSFDVRLYSINKVVFSLFGIFSFSFLFLFFSLNFVVDFFYSEQNKLTIMLLVIISLYKSLNIVEIIYFSLYSYKIRDSRLTELVTIVFCLIISILYILYPASLDYSVISILPIYYFISLTLLFKTTWCN